VEDGTVLAERLERGPVGRCRTAVEQARRPEDERARADARHERSGTREITHALHEHGIVAERSRVPTGEEEEIEVGDLAPGDVGDDPLAVRARRCFRGLGDGANGDLPVAVARPRGEHFVRAGEVEFLDAVPEADRDRVVIHRPRVPDARTASRTALASFPPREPTRSLTPPKAPPKEGRP